MSYTTQYLAGCFEVTKRTPRTVSTEQRRRPIRASYDAAQDSNEVINIWASSDALDADAANSLWVRTKLRQRARYERANNGHVSGILQTQANYVIGTGPKLRLQTNSPGFNSMVETAWKRWALSVNLAKKLRTMCRAKTGDGEAFALIADNPNCPDVVKLDIRLIECDQVSAPLTKADDENYIDGIAFDTFGNPISYDVLTRHPGSSWYAPVIRNEFKTFDARFVCHWFGGDERPGQHRGVPELTPTLNLFGTGRRYREAVVAAAETAADFAVMVEMGIPDDGADLADPFVALPIQKRMMTTLPAGAKSAQMKAEQPTTTYESFTRNMICEEARPLNMPYNIAACDSSGYSYSGGQLDHQTYFVSLDVERQDCESAVLDKIFSVWFSLAQDAYQWTVNPSPSPAHAWDWQGKPHSDPTKIADSRKTRLSCGDASPSEFAAEDGVDYEDRLAALANDYGVTVEEIKAKLFDSNFQKSGGGAAALADDAPAQKKSNGAPKANGVNRMAAMFHEALI